VKLGRRRVLRGALTLPWVVPLCGFARSDTWPRKRAVFEEIGTAVQMTLTVPNLFRRSDTDALASIESGYDTTLEFQVEVLELGTRKSIASRALVVKISRDPWTKKYVVRWQGTTGWVRRSFPDAEQAIAAATTLDRIRIVQSDALDRGTYEEGPYYFVTVVAMRNPLRGESSGRVRRRSGERDVDWFGRLVDGLAGDRPRAEEIVQIRTYPFYLPSGGEGR
jgi:hypothetical protein